MLKVQGIRSRQRRLGTRGGSQDDWCTPQAAERKGSVRPSLRTNAPATLRGCEGADGGQDEPCADLMLLLGGALVHRQWALILPRPGPSPAGLPWPSPGAGFPFPVCLCGLQAGASRGRLGMAWEALCQRHGTSVNFRGLESSGGPSWKWGKGLSVAPAVGSAPGPAGGRQPTSSWARHPEASPCLAVGHLGRLREPHTGLASVGPPRQAGREETVEGGLAAAAAPPASDPRFSRLGPGFLAGGVPGAPLPLEPQPFGPRGL